MPLKTLKAHSKRNKTKRRRGRGDASGAGNYSQRGMKGQSSRSGGKRRPGFEGGQMPLMRRMPKIGGFKCPNRIEYHVVIIGKLEEIFKDIDIIDNESLHAKGLIGKKNQPVKILGHGDIKKTLTIKVAKVSATATEKIEKAKGKIETTQAPRKEKKEAKAEKK